MIVTTENWISERKITSNLGLVRGIESQTMNMWSMSVAMFPILRRVFSSPAAAYSVAWDNAVQRMTQNANQLGAHAIIGVRVENSTLSPIHSVCTAYGTAVLIEREV